MTANPAINIEGFHWAIQVMDDVDAGLFILDKNYNVCVWNKFMQVYSGVSAEQILNKNLFEVISELPETWLKNKIDSALMMRMKNFSSWENRPYIFPFENFCPVSGGIELMYQDLIISPVSSLNGECSHVNILVRDVSDIARSKQHLRKRNRKLSISSQTDGLTKLYNRGYWETLLQENYSKHMQSQEPVSLVMLDIDHFKIVNDTYGHGAGDEVLRHLSEILRSSIRSHDLVGRYGGEEFGIILPETDGEGAIYFCERVRKKSKQTIVKYNDAEIQFSISLGIAPLTYEENSYKHWLSCADQALYQSKETGRNKTTMYSQLT